jgi:hypothetical protein
MSDLNAYVHHPHPYSPFFDEFGMSIPACRDCRREQPIPGGTRCACCLIEWVHALPGDPFADAVVERVAFGPFPVPTREVTA